MSVIEKKLFYKSNNNKITAQRSELMTYLLFRTDLPQKWKESWSWSETYENHNILTWI